MRKVLRRIFNLIYNFEQNARLKLLGKHPDNTPFNYNWPYIRPLKNELQMSKRYFSGVVVDIGAGPAPYFKYFSDSIDHYYGIDLSYKDGYQKVSDKLTFIKARAEKTSIPDGFANTVISTQFLCSIPEPDNVFKEISRMLKTGGYLVLSAPCSQPLITEPFDYLRLTPNYLYYICNKHGLQVISMKPLGDIFTSFALAVSLSLLLNPFEKDGTMRMLPVRQWIFSPLIFFINISAFILESIFKFTRYPANLFLVAQKID